jgi:hypothetical protein
MMTTFKTNANGRGDSFPGYGVSGLRATGISGSCVISNAPSIR